MKLAALAKLIKADAYCKLYNVCYEAGGYDLYIGTRTGIYSLAGFPKAQNSDELAALLDITPNSWKDIQFSDECPESERNMDGMSLADTEEGEMECQTDRIILRANGRDLIPLIESTRRTVGFVDARQLLPLADEAKKSDYYKYFVRKMSSGARYYVVKDGMIARAVVLPCKLDGITKQNLQSLTTMVLRTQSGADIEDLSELEEEDSEQV